jgi:tetratricopeptide (TPR) repeat protein
MTPDSEDGAPQEDNQNWLRRQVQRLRRPRRGNVVIAQVGAGARNIVIGTHNIQINVGGRNLTVPVLLIPLLLVILLALVVYPLAEPLWNPAQMTGQFRIAVAEFGQMDANGHVRATDEGRVLSRWLFQALDDEYQHNANMEIARAIEIWHDSRTDTPQNVRFGIMAGDTPQARRAAAARLADRIQAHMVIYGNLVPDGDAERLELEFYLSPLVNDETAALIGPHRLGKPILLPASFESNRPEVNIVTSEKLQVRADALFWLTIGLTQQVLGRSQQALETFQHAEAQLTDWPDSDGKEILYFFIGREELFLGHAEQAEADFRHALAIEPGYARSEVALGSSFRQRAQAIPPEKRLQAPNYLQQALNHHRHGLELAMGTQDPLIEALARIALAKSYRLMGETQYFLDDYAEANHLFDLAIEQVQQAVPLLKDTRQYRLLAQAYEDQGAAYLQQGLILQGQGKTAESRAHLELARTAYQACIDQGDKAFYDQILHQQVIEQGCQRYMNVTQERLKSLDQPVSQVPAVKRHLVFQNNQVSESATFTKHAPRTTSRQPAIA